MKNKKKLSVSIIIPALNENEGIEKTINTIPKNDLLEMGYNVQILVVDNGSTDGTADLARKAGAEVISELRRGYGYAYKAGFNYAKGDIIATADADMTYPVDYIPFLVKLLVKEDLDFINTNRYANMDSGAMTYLNRIGNAILNRTARLLFHVNLGDSQSGMWVFRKDILNKMVLKSNSMALSEELKLEACYFVNCRWKEVPIKYKARMGRVKLRVWRDGIGNLSYLIKKRINR